MKVTITAVDGPMVGFTCGVGAARARWHGDAVQVGDVKYVELDVEDVVAVDVVPGAELREVVGGFCVPVRVERVDDDGVAVLRVAEGLLMVDLERKLAAGDELEVTVSGLALYDTRV